MRLNVHNVILIIAASFLPVVLILLAIKLFNDDPAICFNDSADGDSYEVWAYDEHSDWRGARSDVKGMLVFGFESGQSLYELSELDYCWYTNKATDPTFSNCIHGLLNITHIQPAEEMTGRYVFLLEGGSQVTQEFSASYCPTGRDVE